MPIPLIYAACDQAYYDTHGEAFCRSARENGYRVKVDVVEGGDAVSYSCERFIRLPDVLKRHPHVLVVDIDSLFNSSLVIADEYDLGLFFRPWLVGYDSGKQLLAGTAYFTWRALPFAKKVQGRIVEGKKYWGCDQAALWETFLEDRDNYRVLQINDRMMNYDFKFDAPIWTAKGNRKSDPVYLERRAAYERA